MNKQETHTICAFICLRPNVTADSSDWASPRWETGQSWYFQSQLYDKNGTILHSSDDYEPLPSPHPRATLFQTESVNCLGPLDTLVLKFGLFAGVYLIT